jgi:alpha-glucosidase
MMMRSHLLPTTVAFCFALGASTSRVGQAAPSRAVATSPDGKVRIELSIPGNGPDGAAPSYQVSFRDRSVILPSRLAIDVSDGAGFARGSAIEGVQTRAIDETYTQRPGKRSRVVNRCEEVVVSLRDRANPPRRWEVILRAYDDGVAVRYRILGREGEKEVAISGEATHFRLPGDASAYYLPLKSYTTSHEARYRHTPVAEVPEQSLFGLPLLAELPGIGWLAVAEANLTDHAGMYLARATDRGAVLTTRLSPRPGETKIAVRAALPHDSPWRVIMVADRLERLVESDLVLNLNAPCALADTSWIRPGKTTFPWWNGFHEEKGEVPFEMGLNTETAKYYIDFCAEAGIPYHSLDGKDNTAWYGGPIVPYKGADITRGVDGLDLPEVLRYAATKGVRIRLWMHWKAAQAHMDRAFPLYREWGVEGVMLDFMDRDDQEMVNFQRRAIETAAANRLTLTFHGVSAPTGLERTYPNLLTHEGVLNLEYDKGDKQGVTPEHELIVAMTRMLAGPLDFHQGSLRGVPAEQFRPRGEAPLVIGTPCRMLACYVVFQNHLPMVADYPSAYRGHPLLPVLVAIPSTWDDTRCLAGKPEELIVVARRLGTEWWVGAMGGRGARPVEVPLGFLGPGRFRAEVLGDDEAAPACFARRTEHVGAADILRGSLAPAGGLLVRLTPAEDGREGR